MNKENIVALVMSNCGFIYINLLRNNALDIIEQEGIKRANKQYLNLN